MEISPASVPVIFSSRILGLAPFTLKSFAVGSTPRLSLMLCVYGVVLILAFTCSTISGVVVDWKSKTPIRMRGITGRVVVVLDVLLIATVSGAAVLGGPSRVKFVEKLSVMLKEIDLILGDNIVLNTKHRCGRAWKLIAVVYGVLSVTIALDNWGYYRFGITLYNDASNLQLYIPFYMLYYILAGFQLQFAHSVLGIGQRYRKLNEKLIEILRKNNYNIDVETGVVNFRVRDLTNEVDVKKTAVKPKIIFHAHYSPSELLHRLAFCNGLLGDSVDIICRANGPPLLCALASCLFHLVATAYFFIDSITSEKGPGFALIQLMWLFVHFARLLLIVEPCYFTCTEAKKIDAIISALISLPVDSDIKIEIQSFSQQLLHRSVQFSVCGLCTLDRTLLTSFASSIATYLVILIQFQKSDGK